MKNAVLNIPSLILLNLLHFSLPEEDLKAVEILLGIFLVNDFEISIYDRTKELVNNIFKKFQETNAILCFIQNAKIFF